MTIQTPFHTRRSHRTLIAGGAGFIGSNICDTLLRRGDTIICLDNLHTAAMRNIRPLLTHPTFRVIEHDVRETLGSEGPLDRIYNFACPASPPHYQQDPAGPRKTYGFGT